MKYIWAIEPKEAADFLQTSLDAGLTSLEAANRLRKNGPNTIASNKIFSVCLLFFKQFTNLMSWILMAAAAVLWFLSMHADAAAIALVVLINGCFGFFQEYRIERSLAELKKFFLVTTKVIRDGESISLSCADVVIGDLLELSAGDYIPADARVVWVSANCSAQQSSLTGEQYPVNKTAFALQEKNLPLGARANMLYAGTSIVSGRVKAIVTATGKTTAAGKVAAGICAFEEDSSPLRDNIGQLGKFILFICFILLIIVCGAGLWHGNDAIELFLTSAALAIAVIPEGLPAVVSISLALGAWRMFLRKVWVRKLSCVETLGCVTVVCSDKTGILTHNQPVAKAIFIGGNTFKVESMGGEDTAQFFLHDMPVSLKEYPYIEDLLSSAALCNSAQLKKHMGRYKAVGDPADGALLVLAAQSGIDKNKLDQDHIFIEEIPFDLQRKMMTVLRRSKQKVIAYIKGAPDILLRRCKYIDHRGTIRPMDQDDLAKILDTDDYLSAQAMRVVAFAYRDMPILSRIDSSAIESDLVFLGLVAMADPARPQIRNSIDTCRRAGVKVVMVTGDHKNTAVAVAKELGIFEQGSLALTGDELDHMSDEEFSLKVMKVSVYARISFEHRLRIVRAWRARAEVVAITGSYASDSVAVREADIGVATGVNGTDVARGAADIVLVDDDFSSIVAAIEGGRRVYANIEKFTRYLLSCNIAVSLIVLSSVFFNFPIPLLPGQILWINLIIVSFPALALSVEPSEPDIMDSPARLVNAPILRGDGVFFTMLWQGILMAVCALAAFLFVRYIEFGSLERSRTMIFAALSCCQLLYSFSCRNFKTSLFNIDLFSNASLISAALGSFVLLMTVVYAPFLQIVFRTQALGFYDWVFILFVSCVPVIIIEMVKFTLCGYKKERG